MNARVLRIALLADGRSDRALLPILTWLLRQQAPGIELAEPGFRDRKPSARFEDEVSATVKLFRPTLLFVHRDAETADPEARRREIPSVFKPTVKVVPVRMTEAWLLVDEEAIRRVADRPGGPARLALPRLSQIEALTDPKSELRDALLTAASVRGRRAKRFHKELPERIYRVADLMDDFQSLRGLSAFTRLEADCRAALVELGLLT